MILSFGYSMSCMLCVFFFCSIALFLFSVDDCRFLVIRPWFLFFCFLFLFLFVTFVWSLIFLVLIFIILEFMFIGVLGYGDAKVFLFLIFLLPLFSLLYFLFVSILVIIIIPAEQRTRLPLLSLFFVLFMYSLSIPLYY